MSAPDLPNKKFKLGILNTHPIQYFAPLYAYLNKLADFDVTALYLSDFSLRGGKDKGFGQKVSWNIDLLAGYDSRFVGGRRATRRVPGGFFSLVAPEVWNAVRAARFDALVIHGHSYAANFIAIAAAKSVGTRVFLRGESHLGLPSGALKSKIRRPLLRLFYAQVDRLLAIGSANAAFYRAMGAAPHKVLVAPYTVDNDRFKAASQMSLADREAWRQRFGIPVDPPAILYAAKFTRRKHPDHLLRAAHLLRTRSTKNFSIVLCGSGEMEAELRSLCQDQGLQNVVFTGFVNQDELPKLYGSCDVFVLPSENEPWGLAVNEAMCAGLPVVVSREVGCVQDLVEPGVNGFTPEAGDIDDLADALLRLVDEPGLRTQMGRASLDRISGWSYRECANTLRAALQAP